MHPFTNSLEVWKRDPVPQFTGDFDMWGQLDGVKNKAGKNNRLARLDEVQGGFPFYCTGTVTVTLSKTR
jgi:hypothetical protein